MTKVAKLKRAWRRLWADEPAPTRSLALVKARNSLDEYVESYCQRTNMTGFHSSQAASIISSEGHKRGASIPTEVRTIALALDQVIESLENAERDRHLQWRQNNG